MSFCQHLNSDISDRSTSLTRIALATGVVLPVLLATSTDRMYGILAFILYVQQLALPFTHNADLHTIAEPLDATNITRMFNFDPHTNIDSDTDLFIYEEFDYRCTALLVIVSIVALWAPTRVFATCCCTWRCDYRHICIVYAILWSPFLESIQMFIFATSSVPNWLVWIVACIAIILVWIVTHRIVTSTQSSDIRMFLLFGQGWSTQFGPFHYKRLAKSSPFQTKNMCCNRGAQGVIACFTCSWGCWVYSSDAYIAAQRTQELKFRKHFTRKSVHAMTIAPEERGVYHTSAEAQMQERKEHNDTESAHVRSMISHASDGIYSRRDLAVMLEQQPKQLPLLPHQRSRRKRVLAQQPTVQRVGSTTTVLSADSGSGSGSGNGNGAGHKHSYSNASALSGDPNSSAPVARSESHAQMLQTHQSAGSVKSHGSHGSQGSSHNGVSRTASLGVIFDSPVLPFEEPTEPWSWYTGKYFLERVLLYTHLTRPNSTWFEQSKCGTLLWSVRSSCVLYWEAVELTYLCIYTTLAVYLRDHEPSTHLLVLSICVVTYMVALIIMVPFKRGIMWQQLCFCLVLIVQLELLQLFVDDHETASYVVDIVCVLVLVMVLVRDVLFRCCNTVVESQARFEQAREWFETRIQSPDHSTDSEASDDTYNYGDGYGDDSILEKSLYANPELVRIDTEDPALEGIAVSAAQTELEMRKLGKHQKRTSKRFSILQSRLMRDPSRRQSRRLDTDMMQSPDSGPIEYTEAYWKSKRKLLHKRKSFVIPGSQHAVPLAGSRKFMSNPLPIVEDGSEDNHDNDSDNDSDSSSSSGEEIVHLGRNLPVDSNDRTSNVQRQSFAQAQAKARSKRGGLVPSGPIHYAGTIDDPELMKFLVEHYVVSSSDDDNDVAGGGYDSDEEATKRAVENARRRVEQHRQIERIKLERKESMDVELANFERTSSGLSSSSSAVGSSKHGVGVSVGAHHRQQSTTSSAGSMGMAPAAAAATLSSPLRSSHTEQELLSQSVSAPPPNFELDDSRAESMYSVLDVDAHNAPLVSPRTRADGSIPSGTTDPTATGPGGDSATMAKLNLVWTHYRFDTPNSARGSAPQHTRDNQRARTPSPLRSKRNRAAARQRNKDRQTRQQSQTRSRTAGRRSGTGTGTGTRSSRSSRRGSAASSRRTSISSIASSGSQTGSTSSRSRSRHRRKNTLNVADRPLWKL
jgi:hypothetical protein